MTTGELVLLTGATGYVGGRLLAALEERGVRVRCLARRPEALAARVGPGTEVVRGDVLDPASLAPALAGVHTAYYLVHSMASLGDFEAEDRAAALAFGRAARDSGVRRIVYLGGLGSPGANLSPHLRSRQETGDCLREGGVPVVELRASVVIGSGSLSFEMIRALVERLPVMTCPRWVETLAQPIAVEDLVDYLVGALGLPEGPGRVFEIGGADRASYGDLMREYARQRGLRRWMVSLPWLTPGLSSRWLGFVTPVYARVGAKLVESLRNPTVVTDPAALEAFPVRPRGYREAIERALRNEEREFAQTRWSDAMSSAGLSPRTTSARVGSRVADSRETRVAVPPDRAFLPIERIGGENGWYFGDWLWRLRGFLDLLVGGPGLRRGRRDPLKPVVGEPIDFWRVESYEPGRRLRLGAEMRLPGRAWLEFEARPDGEGTVLRQSAIFEPRGLGGILYWYGLLPIHAVMFRAMMKAVARAAEREGGA